MSELPRPLPPPTWRDRLAVVAAWRDGVPLPALAAIVGLVVVAAVVAATILGSSVAKPDVALTLPRADATPSVGVASSSSTTTPPLVLRIHAAGAVAKPGVVEVPVGARVVDVVHAAGGAAPDADLNQINLAQLVADGERIYIPRAGEVVMPASSGSSSATRGATSDGVVNLNEASETELEALPGVGPATAKAIVDYRAQHGRFRSVDDLLNVRGIGPAKLGQIKPHARV